MKKFLSFFISLAMILAISIPTYATSAEQYPIEQNISVNGYDFVISEEITSNYEISRTYSRDTNSLFRSSVDIEETQALLLALGMDNDEINAIPEDTLLDYATGKEITVITSYSKYNESTKTTTNLPKDIAIRAAESISKQQEEYILGNQENVQTFGNKPNQSTTPGTFKDSYMRITHSAINLGNGSYKFTTSATWLSMPVFRGYDSVGSCAMNTTVTPNTSYGKYWYTTKIYGITDVTTSHSGNIEITNRHNAVNGNWYGSAGIFNLPNDTSGSGMSIINIDLQAYYEYKGHVSEPKNEHYFNTVGTYCHSTIGIGINPSISINFSKGVSASATIGLQLISGKDIRSAELEIHYIPKK